MTWSASFARAIEIECSVVSRILLDFVSCSAVILLRHSGYVCLHPRRLKTTVRVRDRSWRQAYVRLGDEWRVPLRATERFRLDSVKSAKELVASLGHEQRRQLLSALHETASLAQFSASEDAMANQSFRRADRRYPRGLLDRAEFIQALRAHKLREEQARLIRDRLPVPMSRLLPLAVATGVPYVGFGFLDNFIMVKSNAIAACHRSTVTSCSDLGRRID